LEAKAVEKFIRISPRKLRYVADALIIRKAVQSAAANATENHKMNEDDLVVEKIFINEGPILKRFRPRARGRATKIRKRTSHLTVIVSDGKEEEAKGNGSKG